MFQAGNCSVGPLFLSFCCPCHYDSQANQQQLSSGSFFHRSFLSSYLKYGHKRDVILCIFVAQRACCVSLPLVSAAALANPLLTASTSVLLPDLVSLINQAVQAAVQASQRQPEPAIAGPASYSGASSSSAPLGSLASTFLATGTGFQPSISGSSSPGRPIPLVLSTFVSSFNVPVQAIISSSGHALSGVSAQLPPSIVNSLADQPFVVGPGFSPVCQACFANP